MVVDLRLSINTMGPAIQHQSCKRKRLRTRKRPELLGKVSQASQKRKSQIGSGFCVNLDINRALTLAALIPFFDNLENNNPVRALPRVRSLSQTLTAVRVWGRERLWRCVYNTRAFLRKTHVNSTSLATL